MAEMLSIGLIGAGRIGSSHAQVVAERVPMARLVAVADPRPEAAEALGARFSARAFTDPSELIHDPDVEAVLIAASSEAHADLIVAAAGVGKAIFCEKPMSLTREDADRALAPIFAGADCLILGLHADRVDGVARRLDGLPCRRLACTAM